MLSDPNLALLCVMSLGLFHSATLVMKYTELCFSLLTNHSVAEMTFNKRRHFLQEKIKKPHMFISALLKKTTQNKKPNKNSNNKKKHHYHPLSRSPPPSPWEILISLNWEKNSPSFHFYDSSSVWGNWASMRCYISKN